MAGYVHIIGTAKFVRRFKTSGGQWGISFTVDCGRKGSKEGFYSLRGSAFGEKADALGKLKDGDAVSVQGFLKDDSYKDKNGQWKNQLGVTIQDCVILNAETESIEEGDFPGIDNIEPGSYQTTFEAPDIEDGGSQAEEADDGLPF